MLDKTETDRQLIINTFSIEAWTNPLSHLPTTGLTGSQDLTPALNEPESDNDMKVPVGIRHDMHVKTLPEAIFYVLR